MPSRVKPGLGELLRYLAERIDQGAESHYLALNLSYRPRYTPVLRAIAAGAESVTDITTRTHLTQGAVSQTLSLMTSDGIVARHALEDGRKSGFHLTHKGKHLLEVLAPQWRTTFAAIDVLEKEIGHPLLRILQDTARALERQDFAARLASAAAEPNTTGSIHVD